MNSDRFLHLDLKGIVPSVRKFREWIPYWAGLGFQGIVLECDCRIPWNTWRGAGEPLFSKEDLAAIVLCAEENGMEVIPLIQSLGHLEWILKEEKYACLREDGFYNQLCPQHPESLSLLCRWIDEVSSLFPHARRIHLGGDEAWHLGSCPLCRKKMEEDPEKRGKTGLFADHILRVCRYAAEEKGLQCMIWDDMFCREPENAAPLLKRFPEGTVLLHWKYSGSVQDGLSEVSASGAAVWGASALCCSWGSHWEKMLHPIGERLKNIEEWEKTGLPLLHTTWGRSTNLWEPYGPWEALIPEFIAAGQGPDAWKAHPWHDFTEHLDQAVSSGEYRKLEEILAEAESLPAANAFEEQGKGFYLLAVRFELLHREALSLLQLLRSRKVMKRYGRQDPVCWDKIYGENALSFRRKAEEWLEDLKEFWHKNELSDEEEYRETREAGFFLDLLPQK